jgi:tetratricopeptide (TPR) repeat protein
LRHRVGVAATATVVLALGTGLLLAAWQWQEAVQQRQFALAQLNKSEATVDFVSTVLLDHIDRGQPVSLEQLLQRSRRYATTSADGLSKVMAVFVLANWHSTLGDAAVAEQLAADTLRTMPADTGPNLRQQLMCLHANAMGLKGLRTEAAAELGAALALTRDDPDARSYCLLVRSYLAGRGRIQPEVIIQSSQEALATLDQAGLSFATRRALLMGELAYAHSQRGDVRQADANYRSALAQLGQAGKVNSSVGYSLLGNWGAARLTAGAPKEALLHFQRAREIARLRAGDRSEPPALVSNIGHALRVLGRYEAARSEYQTALNLARQAGQPPVQAHALIGLAGCALGLGQWAQAQSLLDQAQHLLGAASHQPQPVLGAGWMAAQAELWLRQQRANEVRALLDPHLAKLPAQDTDSPALRTAWSVLAPKLHGEAASALGLSALAREDLDRALQAAQALQPAGSSGSYLTGLTWLALGQHHLQVGDARAAADALQHADEELTASLGADSPITLSVRQLRREGGPDRS